MISHHGHHHLHTLSLTLIGHADSSGRSLSSCLPDGFGSAGFPVMNNARQSQNHHCECVCKYPRGDLLPGFTPAGQYEDTDDDAG